MTKNYAEIIIIPRESCQRKVTRLKFLIRDECARTPFDVTARVRLAIQNFLDSDAGTTFCSEKGSAFTWEDSRSISLSYFYEQGLILLPEESDVLTLSVDAGESFSSHYNPEFRAFEDLKEGDKFNFNGSIEEVGVTGYSIGKENHVGYGIMTKSGKMISDDMVDKLHIKLEK